MLSPYGGLSSLPYKSLVRYARILISSSAQFPSPRYVFQSLTLLLNALFNPLIVSVTVSSPTVTMQFIFLVSLLASSINALPLNINLGAYSPALVVGDGEISFGGKQDVSNLMNALEGAAVSGAAANGQAGAAAPVSFKQSGPSN